MCRLQTPHSCRKLNGLSWIKGKLDTDRSYQSSTVVVTPGGTTHCIACLQWRWIMYSLEGWEQNYIRKFGLEVESPSGLGAQGGEQACTLWPWHDNVCLHKVAREVTKVSWRVKQELRWVEDILALQDHGQQLRDDDGATEEDRRILPLCDHRWNNKQICQSI